MIGLALRKRQREEKEKKDLPEAKNGKKAKKNAIKTEPKIAGTIAEMKRKRHDLFRREVEYITNIEQMPLPSEEQGDAFLVGITGKRKSGKTFLLNKMIHTIWKKLFNKIYVLSLTAKTPTQQKNYFGSWGGNVVYIDNWNEGFFKGVIAELERKPKEKHLIVIDDMSRRMRERLYSSQIDDFAFLARHWRCSVCWLGQCITLFTPGFRQEADAFILFREENMSELRLLHREWGFGEFDHFIVTLIENTLKKHSWIMLRNIGGTIHILAPPPQSQEDSGEQTKENVSKPSS